MAETAGSTQEYDRRGKGKIQNPDFTLGVHRPQCTVPSLLCRTRVRDFSLNVLCFCQDLRARAALMGLASSVDYDEECMVLNVRSQSEFSSLIAVQVCLLHLHICICRHIHTNLPHSVICLCLYAYVLMYTMRSV
jgi:hypothetical protein